MSLDKIQIGFDGESAVLIAPDPVKLKPNELEALARVCEGLARALRGGGQLGPIQIAPIAPPLPEPAAPQFPFGRTFIVDNTEPDGGGR